MGAQALKYTMRCVNESMRLYPHPPVLLRRAMVPDELPGDQHRQFCAFGSLFRWRLQDRSLSPWHLRMCHSSTPSHRQPEAGTFRIVGRDGACPNHAVDGVPLRESHT